MNRFTAHDIEIMTKTIELVKLALPKVKKAHPHLVRYNAAFSDSLDMIIDWLKENMREETADVMD